MLCPSCNSAVADNLRFCLHCGHYLGEPDAETQIGASRQPPSSTVPFESRTADAVVRVRWPLYLALSMLAAIVLLVIGILIGASMLHNAGGVAGNLPKNNRQTVLGSSPAPRPKLTPEIQPEEATEPPPIAMPEPTPPPTVLVIDWSDWLKDGSAMAWKLSPGVYRLVLTASGDGATAEWVGASCSKTQPLQRVTMICEMPGDGQLVVTNPTTFGLGKAVSTTVKVTRLP